MEIAEIGEFGLIRHLTENIKIQNAETRKGVGDDCAVLQFETGRQVLVTTDLLMEGVHFDLQYTPLKHLGYKSAMVNLSDIYAMNGRPRQMTVSLALSKRFKVEDMEQFYEGLQLACEAHGCDIVGGDTTSSLTGLAISITCIGDARPEDIVYRDGAKDTDLICVTGDLGAAYMGLQLLEREKAVFNSQLRDLAIKSPGAIARGRASGENNGATSGDGTSGATSGDGTSGAGSGDGASGATSGAGSGDGASGASSGAMEDLVADFQPDFSGREYLLERQLKPEARRDIIEALAKAGIRPTAMMDISDGLSSELHHICSQSHTGCRIYEERIPLDYQTAVMAEELNMNVTTCALNGGEDYELLFTVPLTEHDRVAAIPGVKVIGHITKPELGLLLVCRDGTEMELRAQGWNHMRK